MTKVTESHRTPERPVSSRSPAKRLTSNTVMIEEVTRLQIENQEYLKLIDQIRREKDQL